RNFVGGYLIEECVELFDIKRTLKEMLVDIAIDTLEGTMRVDYGDYIIKDEHGDFYPCRLDVFKQTYEEVIDDITKDNATEFCPATQFDWLPSNCNEHTCENGTKECWKEWLKENDE
ncbi:MAG: hypothetical protein SO324_15410, partial [Thomasclavelia ramosa]|nr:hypothetical protein [Thomasclavelia ramosa]